MKEERNCAFQYYNGRKIVVDVFNKTLTECKELFNYHYEDMVMSQMETGGIEVAIWINMNNESDYRETHIHLSDPLIKDHRLCEVVYYSKYRI